MWDEAYGNVVRLLMDDSGDCGAAFQSRLIVGTGKYKDGAETQAAIEASGAEMVTVAVRRVNLDRSQGVAAGLHRSEEVLPAAEYGGLLYGGGGDPGGAAGARGGAFGLGEDRGDRRHGDAVSGCSGDG